MVSAIDIEAGRAFITLYVRSGAFKDNMNALSARMQKYSRKLRSAAMQMGTAAVIMAAPFVAGTKVFAEFSKQMAFVATMLDKPQRHMAEFTAGIREMSVEFGESTETLAHGMYDILSAGFAPAKAMHMLAVTTKAAKAGMTDATNATQAIVAVLNSYSLGAEHAQMVSDSLFTTVKKGVLTFGELAGHIGMVSSTAAAAGVKIDEMGAALAIITRGGVETSHAVVALNNILKAFLSPTGASAEFANQLATMGLGPIKLQGIKNKGFLNILKEIGALPPDLIARLFPSIRGMRGIMAIKAGLADIDEIYKAWINKAGATDEAFKKVKKSFGFLIDRIKQAGILILSYIGEALAERLELLSEAILLAAKGFGSWINRNKALIALTAKLIITLGGVAVAALIAAKALALLAVITAVLSGPTGWVGLAVGISAGIAALAAFSALAAKVRSEIQGVIADAKLSEGAGGKPPSGLSLVDQLRADKSRIEKEISDIQLRARKLKKGWGFGEGFPGPSRAAIENRNMEVKRLQLVKKIAEASLSGLNKQILAAQKRQMIEKGTADILKKQSYILAAMIGNRGFFLGFQHTPVLAFSSMSGPAVEQDQLSALKQIVENTGSVATTGKPGAIVKAIEGIGTE